MMNIRRPFRIVIVGHVDHGKSTLIGRLFHDTGSLPDGKLEQMQAMCTRRGVPFEWSFLMDAFQAERDQNITIDTAQIWFETTKRPYVIIDAPGHREFLKNMITGAAAADAALLLIAADEGVQDQSRRHAYMLAMLGVERVAVLVNKMDLVNHDQATFERIESEYRAFLSEIGLTPEVFIPISARDGDTITTAPAETMPWYKGPSVLSMLDRFKLPSLGADGPLRFPIQDIYRFDDRRILAGRIESGKISVGDELLFVPGHRRARVQSIETWSAPPLGSVTAGTSIGITLDEQIFVERGQVATRVESPPHITDRFAANVFWMSRSPLKEGSVYKLKLMTQEVSCTVESIEAALDISSLEMNSEAVEVKKDDVARVILRTERPVSVDLHSDIEETGRFVLVDNYDISGGGIITRIEASSAASSHAERVSPGERVQRQRHTNTLIWLRGEPSARAKLATSLERALFERGLQSYALEHSDWAPESANFLGLTASHLASAGVVVITHAPELGDTQSFKELLAGQGTVLVERVVSANDEASDHLGAIISAMRL